MAFSYCLQIDKFNVAFAFKSITSIPLKNRAQLPLLILMSTSPPPPFFLFMPIEIIIPIIKRNAEAKAWYQLPETEIVPTKGMGM